MYNVIMIVDEETVLRTRVLGRIRISWSYIAIAIYDNRSVYASQRRN